MVLWRLHNYMLNMWAFASEACRCSIVEGQKEKTQVDGNLLPLSLSKLEPVSWSNLTDRSTNKNWTSCHDGEGGSGDNSPSMGLQQEYEAFPHPSPTPHPAVLPPGMYKKEGNTFPDMNALTRHEAVKEGKDQPCRYTSHAGWSM